MVTIQSLRSDVRTDFILEAPTQSLSDMAIAYYRGGGTYCNENATVTDIAWEYVNETIAQFLNEGVIGSIFGAILKVIQTLINFVLGIIKKIAELFSSLFGGGSGGSSGGGGSSSSGSSSSSDGSYKEKMDKLQKISAEIKSAVDKAEKWHTAEIAKLEELKKTIGSVSDDELLRMKSESDNSLKKLDADIDKLDALERDLERESHGPNADSESVLRKQAKADATRTAYIYRNDVVLARHKIIIDEMEKRQLETDKANNELRDRTNKLKKQITDMDNDVCIVKYYTITLPSRSDMSDVYDRIIENQGRESLPFDFNELRDLTKGDNSAFRDLHYILENAGTRKDYNPKTFEDILQRIKNDYVPKIKSEVESMKHVKITQDDVVEACGGMQFSDDRVVDKFGIKYHYDEVKYKDLESAKQKIDSNKAVFRNYNAFIKSSGYDEALEKLRNLESDIKKEEKMSVWEYYKAKRVNYTNSYVKGKVDKQMEEINKSYNLSDLPTVYNTLQNLRLQACRLIVMIETTTISTLTKSYRNACQYNNNQYDIIKDLYFDYLERKKKFNDELSKL